MDEQFRAQSEQWFPFLTETGRSGRVSQHRFEKGSLLLVSGAVCESVVLVVSGVIRVYQVSESGRELTLYRVGPGESCVLMLSSVLAEQSYPAAATAESDVNAVTVPVDIFRTWMRTHSGVQHFVYDTLHRRLTAVMLLVHEITFGKMETRIALYLLQRTSLVQPEVILRHEDIAVELGTAREVVTRMLRHFEREGMISTGKGRITVLHREQLNEHCKSSV